MVDVSVRLTGRLKTGADGLVSNSLSFSINMMIYTHVSRLYGLRLYLGLREWHLATLRYGMDLLSS